MHVCSNGLQYLSFSLLTFYNRWFYDSDLNISKFAMKLYVYRYSKKHKMSITTFEIHYNIYSVFLWQCERNKYLLYLEHELKRCCKNL